MTEAHPPTSGYPGWPVLRGRLDFWLGMALGLPVAFPREPFYLLALGAFLVAVPRMRLASRSVILVLALIGLSVLSGLVSPYASGLNAFRVGYVSAFFALFWFGHGIRDRTTFLWGFVIATAVLGGAVAATFLATGQWTRGALVFILPALRDWGRGIFPDWPNFLAALLGLGAIVGYTMLRAPVPALLAAAGAVATTSRTGILALLVIGAVAVARSWRRPAVRWTVLVAGPILALLLWRPVIDRVRPLLADPVVTQRLVKSDDRVAIYSFSLALVREHPWSGVGHVLLDASIGAPASSFHNSYLETAVRHGVPALLVWLALLFPPLTLWRRRDLWPAAAYLALAAGLNNLLKHPHFFEVWSVLLLGATQAGRAERAE